MKIGICSKGYSNERNINYITNNFYVKINFLNGNAYFRVLSKYISKYLKIDIKNRLFIEGYNGVYLERFFYDIAHFFNGFSISQKPWVSTFESKLPFIDKMHNLSEQKKEKIHRIVLSACASDSCKALIAMSKSSLNLEINLLSQYPEYNERIQKKLLQIYPPQKLYIRSWEEKNLESAEKLRFIFVGREFYRKGGYDILKCFESLSGEFHFELILVSRLINVNRRLFSDRIEVEAKNLIEKHNGTWLTYHPELENETVIELMKKCHIGLLPTYSDTFGYSVLEFQACGCPVVTTDVRALPEINNIDVGWVIDTGKKDRHFEIANPEMVSQNRVIQNGMKKIIVGIFENQGLVKLKAEKAIERIQKDHSPTEYQKQLEKIYTAALS